MEGDSARARSADFEDGSANPSVSHSDSNSTSGSLQFARSLISLTDERPRKIRSVDADLSSLVSPFEELPRELIWKIFEYAPEMICELRLTSRILQSIMDEYALRPSTILLVKSEVELNLRGLPTVKVCMEIHVSKLLKLRLRLRNPCLDLVNRLKKSSMLKDDMIAYASYLNTPAEGDDLLEIIGAIMGMEIKKAHLIDCIERPMVVSRLLQDNQITKVIFETASLSFADEDLILKFIMKHKVDHLSLRLNTFAMPDPARTLLRFSLSVQAMEIFQNNDTALSPDSKYFLGFHDIDWVPLIIDILSNKLDTFFIHNYYFPYFLNKNGAEILKECIPKLNKKIWFGTSCKAYPNGIKQYNNEYSVEGDPSNQFVHAVLQIKHISRKSQQYHFF